MKIISAKLLWPSDEPQINFFLIQKLQRNLLDEAADLRKPRFSIDHALSRRRQRQFFLRTGDSDIAETPFFFDGVLIIRKDGHAARKQPVLHAA